MQKLFKNWFGDKAEMVDETEIVIDGETNAVVRTKSKKSEKESGATAIEYALIASLIAVAIIGATQTLGKNVGTTFKTVSDQLQTA